MFKFCDNKISWLLMTLAFLALPSYAVLATTWVSPTATPPNGNIPAPVNIGNTSQEKTGTLMLSKDNLSYPLVLRVTGSENYVSFRVNDTDGPNNTARWILPSITPTVGQVLIAGPDTDGDEATMNLKWEDPSTMSGSDSDWYYYQNNIQASATGISSNLFTGVTSVDWDTIPNYTNNSGNNTSRGAGDLYVQDQLEVDGVTNHDGLLNANNTLNANLGLNLKNSGGITLPLGAMLFGGAGGAVSWDSANLFWDNTNKRLGIGTATPLSQLHVYKTSGNNAEIDLQSAAGSHWGIYDDRVTREFRLWYGTDAGVGSNRVVWDTTGTMTIGTVPWARLNAFPTACNAGQYVSAIGGSLTCGTPSGSLPAGVINQTLRHNGTNWVANNFLWNTGTQLGISTTSPTAGTVLDVSGVTRLGGNVNVVGNLSPTVTNTYNLGTSSLSWLNLSVQKIGLNADTSASFNLNSGGHIGPASNASYDLGSATYRWRKIYANGIDVPNPGDITLNLPAGAVPFGSPSGSLGYDSANFLYNNTTDQLSVGSGTSTATGTFALMINGHVGPNGNQKWDLGSPTMQWRDVYAQSIHFGADIFTPFTEGSVIFQKGNKLAQNNNNFFWDDVNKRLGIGFNNPEDRLDIYGDERLGSFGATVTSAGTNVTGSGTVFSFEFKTGDIIVINGNARVVKRVIDDEHLEITSSLNVGSSSAYNIKSKSFGVNAENNNELGLSFVNDGLHLGGVYDYLLDIMSSNIFRVYVGSKLYMHNHGYTSLSLAGETSTGYVFTNTFVGTDSGVTFGGESYLNSAYGYKSMYNNTGGIIGNSAFGAFALSGANNVNANSGNNNNAFGAYALFSTRFGNNNIAIGNSSLYWNKDGNNNIAIGNEALKSTLSDHNIAIGHRALYSNQSLSGGNLAVGSLSGENNTGANNVFMGVSSGQNNTGSSNVFIGNKAGQNSTASNTLIINNVDANENDSLIYGQFASAGAGNSFVRFNGDKLQVKDEANSTFRSGRTDAHCNLYSTTTSFVKTFFVDGIMVCRTPTSGTINGRTYPITTIANCNAATLTNCCADTGGC